MKLKSVGSLTDEELVDRFAAISLDQDDALLGSEYGRFNRLYGRKITVLDELKNRQGDRRRLLLRLFEHPNAQVRLNAANATLAVAPLEARKMLQAIANSREYPQAGDAGMSLAGLDDGTYRPT